MKKKKIDFEVDILEFIFFILNRRYQIILVTLIGTFIFVTISLTFFKSELRKQDKIIVRSPSFKIYSDYDFLAIYKHNDLKLVKFHQSLLDDKITTLHFLEDFINDLTKNKEYKKFLFDKNLDPKTYRPEVFITAGKTKYIEKHSFIIDYPIYFNGKKFLIDYYNYVKLETSKEMESIIRHYIEKTIYDLNFEFDVLDETIKKYLKKDDSPKIEKLYYNEYYNALYSITKVEQKIKLAMELLDEINNEKFNYDSFISSINLKNDIQIIEENKINKRIFLLKMIAFGLILSVLIYIFYMLIVYLIQIQNYKSNLFK
jgi:hypothetical protein